MNILVLNPPAVDSVKIIREGRCMQRQEAWGTSWAPLSLAIIAAILRNNGFTVQLKDCSNDGISFEKLKSIIRDFKPSLIVANTATPSITSDLKIANLAKEIDKNIKTVFFGIHVTVLNETVFKKNSAVELIANGEPEYTIRDLALALRDKHSINNVKGLSFRENNQIIHNEKRPFIDNLDELPYPAWDLVNINGYRLPITGRPFLLLLTGRGCSYRCKICAAGAFYGKKSRLRSPKRIVDEIKYVRDRFGINDFFFWSEDAISDREHIHKISQSIINEAPGIRWVCSGRVDIVDEELLGVMKKSGCWMIGYGVESGSQKVLDLMRKNITIKDIERAVTLTKQAGIEITGHVIVGYPGETKNDVLDTIKLIKRLDMEYIQVYCCVPYPGSPLYNELRNKDLLKHCDWSMYSQTQSVINTEYLSPQEVMALRSKIIKSFYFNPRRMIKMLSKVKSLQELISLVSLGRRYIKSWVNK